MWHWHKRFVIGLNIALFCIYLDVALLIFVRSVNRYGIYQTMDLKRLTFLTWTLVYAFIWVVQGLVYVIIKHRHSKQGLQKSLSK